MNIVLESQYLVSMNIVRESHYLVSMNIVLEFNKGHPLNLTDLWHQ